MLKQVRVNGQPFELHSRDGGATWSSSFEATVAYQRRKAAALSTRLTARELHWIDLINREPDDQVDADSIRSAVKYAAYAA